MAKVISIVNPKGGTGKSACTANLAVGLAQKNMKVLIVDADPQSDAVSYTHLDVYKRQIQYCTSYYREFTPGLHKFSAAS